MNNPWEFGWEAIGAIFGILAFMGFIVAEWEKINKLMPKLIGLIVILAFMATSGFLLAQSSFWWRIVALILGVLYGMLIGAGMESSASNNEKTSGMLVLVATIGIIGTFIGFWISTLISNTNY